MHAKQFPLHPLQKQSHILNLLYHKQKNSDAKKWHAQKAIIPTLSDLSGELDAYHSTVSKHRASSHYKNSLPYGSNVHQITIQPTKWLCKLSSMSPVCARSKSHMNSRKSIINLSEFIYLYKDNIDNTHNSLKYTNLFKDFNDNSIRRITLNRHTSESTDVVSSSNKHPKHKCIFTRSKPYILPPIVHNKHTQPNIISTIKSVNSITFLDNENLAPWDTTYER